MRNGYRGSEIGGRETAVQPSPRTSSRGREGGRDSLSQEERAGPRAERPLSLSLHLRVPPSLVPGAWSLVPIYLAESAWIYLVLRSLVAMSDPSLQLSAVAVMAPYGVATAVALLMGIWTQDQRAGRDAGLNTPSPRIAGPRTPSSQDRGAATPITHGSPPNTPARAIVFTALNLLAATASLLAVIWWELYRGEALLDGSWLVRALEEARGSTDSLPPAVWLVAVGLFLWWRGSHLAQEEDGFPSLVGRFFWGTAALLALTGMGGTSPLDTGLVSLLMAGYLFFGIAAVAMARLEAAQEGRAGSVDFGSQRWVWALALAVLVAGFGLSLLLLSPLGELASRLREWLFDGLLPALLEALGWIAHLLGLDQPPKPVPALPPEGAGLPAREAGPLLGLPDQVRELFRRLFDLIWITLILYALYSWIRRWSHGRSLRAGSGVRGERIPWGFKLDLQRILLAILLRLLSRWPALSRWIPRVVTEEDQTREVRHLYRKLLAWGREQGRTRETWATPREYQEMLSDLRPELQPHFRTLTESYLRVRYGGPPLNRQELEAASLGWRCISGRVDSRCGKDVK